MGCRCANRRCHSRDSGIDLAVDAVALRAGVDCRTSTMDRFLFFSFDLPVEAEVAGNGVVAVAGNGAVAVAGSGAMAVTNMVAGKVAGVMAGTAVISDVYAAASVVMFTIHRSPILDPEIKIPPGDVVNTPRPNVERAPARSNWPIERGDSEHRCVYRLLLET